MLENAQSLYINSFYIEEFILPVNNIMAYCNSKMHYLTKYLRPWYTSLKYVRVLSQTEITSSSLLLCVSITTECCRTLLKGVIVGQLDE